MEYSVSKSDLYSLILQAIEGRISERDFVQLETYLQKSSEYREIYSDLSIMYAYLRRPALTFNMEEEHLSTFDATFWQELAEHEKTAPEIEISQEHPQHELVQKVVYPPREKRKVSKFSLVFLALNAAAILFFVLFIKFAPSKLGVEVATLADSINAKWADMDDKMEKGTHLVTGTESLLLREGCAELLFDNHTRVILEGPAEFQVLTEDQIKLRYGRLYAIVPREGIGFTVTTQTAKVIDLGTEFGIDADAHGETYLCVTKGKTSLIAGNKSNKSNIEVSKGIAKKVSGVTQTVSDAVFKDRLFVRHINSTEELLWRGQMDFNLADVVGGGNGFGTGQLDEGISLSDGAMESDYHGEGLRGTGAYILVPGSVYVDGVFVPGSSEKPSKISSQGHTFKECPATSRYYTVLKNGGIAKRWAGIDYPLELNGQVYGTPENPVLSMRSNAGITFDLDAVRNTVPGCEVQSFRSIVGVSSNAVEISKLETTPVDGQLIDVFSAREGKIGKADVFVLVDGQLRQTASLTCNPATIVNMDIKLTPKDRFLTLVSTQGDNEWTHDWVMFTEPYLILDTAE